MIINNDYTVLPDAHLKERIEELDLLISENTMYLEYLNNKRSIILNEIQRRDQILKYSGRGNKNDKM